MFVETTTSDIARAKKTKKKESSETPCFLNVSSSTVFCTTQFQLVSTLTQ